MLIVPKPGCAAAALAGVASVLFHGREKAVDAEQQIGMADLNLRQINGLGYAAQNGRITNREYQRINDTNRNTATYDLKGLVFKGRLKRTGNVKSTSYVPVLERPAENTMKKIR